MTKSKLVTGSLPLPAFAASSPLGRASRNSPGKDSVIK